jgi:hypothetical protein
MAMVNNLEFTGEFEVASKQSLTPGGWYIGFACGHCRQHFAILDEPTNSGKLGLSGDAVFRAICPNCGKIDEYRVSNLILFESAQGGAISTA